MMTELAALPMLTPSFVDQQTTPTSAEQIAADIIAGLRGPAATLAPKYFYDQLGSQLFEAITVLPEYYVTRTEREIFTNHAAAMATAIRAALGHEYQLVDLGAGNCAKAAGLLSEFAPSRYIAVDISVDFLRTALAALQDRFPTMPMTGISMDFSAQIRLPADLALHPTLCFYPGSSLGNFEPAQAVRFLSQTRQMAPRTGLLLGVDLVKATQVLETAYDDAVGVTAAFNRNALRNVNKLARTNFDLRQWIHRAHYNVAAARIEIYLEAAEALTVSWPHGQRSFAKGERILTEYSHKWTIDRVQAQLAEAGYGNTHIWTDEHAWFAVVFAAP
jgi:L-histidine Nalpha-methyltransferase